MGEHSFQRGEAKLYASKGIGFYSFIFFLLMFLGVAYFTIKVYPIFNEKLKVDSALDSLASSDNSYTMTSRQISSALDRRFSIDYVSMTPKDIAKNISLKKVPDGVELTFSYLINSALTKKFNLTYSYQKTVILARQNNK